MPGYDLEINGEYAHLDSLLCPSCKLILRDAIQTEEGVRLCKTCYDSILRWIYMKISRYSLRKRGTYTVYACFVSLSVC